MTHSIICTSDAPAPIGSYSQAVQAGNTVYLSGQIPLDPVTMELVPGDVRAQIEQVFLNIKTVVTAAGSTLDEVVKLTVYLMDLTAVKWVNEIMATYFTRFPARTTIQVSALPKGALVEIEAIVVQKFSR